MEEIKSKTKRAFDVTYKDGVESFSTIDVLGSSKNVYGTIILNLISADRSIVEAVALDAKEKGGNFAVELTINGKSFRFLDIVDMMVGDYDRHVQEAAKEMVHDKLRAKMDPIDEMLDDVRDKMQTVLDSI